MKALLAVFRFIVNHPISGKSKFRSLMRFVYWQLRCLITDKPYIHSFTSKSKLIIRKGMTGATGNLYCGLHEYSEMLFLLHFLRKGDVFIDVGANIGSYTLLASAEVEAKSYSFEPVPHTFQQLQDNVNINRIDNLTKLYNIGLASKKGNLTFSVGNDSSMNHVSVQSETNGEKIVVDIDTLDSCLLNVQPNLLKIDVEGFEHEVLMGASRILKENSLHAIIIELNSSGLNYGFSDQQIHDLLTSYGFEPYIYNPFQRELELVNYNDYENIIYVRDLNFVKNRVTSSKKIKILNLEI